MHPLQTQMELITWAGKNLSHNLKFIADDKLDWKPAPSAKSALEICAEVVGVARHMPHMIKGETDNIERPVFTSREEAQQNVESATADYAAFLQTLGPDDMSGEVQMPFGAMAKIEVIGIPVVDAVHHHGQIAYIQTLLGDTDSHFYEMNI